MANLRGKTLFITGASRGIGKAIGMRAAQDGANIVIVAKTTEPQPTLPGTVYTVVKEIEEAGGRALACPTDIRFEEQVLKAVDSAIKTFGGIDIVVNNASAIGLTQTIETPMKRYDLMQQVNTRGTFLCSKACLPYLLRSENPHILNISPPLNVEPRWFAPHLAYTISKFGMSLCALGMAEELKGEGIAVNTLWPRTVIATSALANFPGGQEAVTRCRKPEIMADAAHALLTRSSRECSGNFFVDEEVLNSVGIKDFDRYAVCPGQNLLPDFFI